MRTIHTSLVGRIAAVFASAVTTLALLSAVVSLSEPQRSQLVAATADRQMANQENSGLEAKPVQTRRLALNCPLVAGSRVAEVGQKEAQLRLMDCK